jgi:acyl carrier protein
MKIQENLFLQKIKSILELDEVLSLKTCFKDIDAIDSLSYMVISVWLYDDFDIKIPAIEIEKFKSLEGLFNFVNK